MIQSASGQLQEAIYVALTQTTGLTTLLGGTKIYDFVPRHTKPPYITIGITQEFDWSTSTEEGREHIITLHTWTLNQGRREADEIQQTIEGIMAAASLTMTNHLMVNLAFEFSEIRRDPDGETLHGILRYRVTTEPIL